MRLEVAQEFMLIPRRLTLIPKQANASTSRCLRTDQDLGINILLSFVNASFSTRRTTKLIDTRCQRKKSISGVSRKLAFRQMVGTVSRGIFRVTLSPRPQISFRRFFFIEKCVSRRKQKEIKMFLRQNTGETVK